jgi:hypothetical protein
MLKEGYDHFEATRQEPKVTVCEKRYVFDAAPPDNASRPLSFNARGKCPVYQLDKNIADAVLDKRRTEQYQMAEYMAQRVATVAPRSGIDGGMNPVFEAELRTQDGYDSKGRPIKVATAPGALPRSPDQPAPTKTVSVPAAPELASAPVVMANVPMPKPAPQAKQGEAPPENTSIAGFLGNLFSSSNTAQTETTAQASTNEDMALRGTKTEVAAKSRAAQKLRTASAHPAPRVKPHEPASAKPKAVVQDAQPAAPSQAPRPAVVEAATAAPAQSSPRTGASELRTAYSAPPASQGGLLSGAQPVVPAGTFDSRWSGLH